MSKWKDGLPPVGEWCFGESEAGVEFKCFIIATHTSGDSKVVVFRYEDGELEAATDGNSYGFRPLKSEAELKRDELKEIAYQNAGLVWQATGQGVLDVVDKLIDAGYRKINPLSDEQVLDGIPKSFNPFTLNQQAFIDGAHWARSQILGDDND